MSAPICIAVEVLPHAEGLGLPAYATPGSSGMDLRAAIDESIVIAPGRLALVPTGLRVALPFGLEFQVRSRSGMALKHGVMVLNSPGTIDADYRGEVQVILANLGPDPFTIDRGMRIAQIVLCQVERVEWTAGSVEASERGAGGFGSTGKA